MARRIDKEFNMLPPGAIRPEGWLYAQLQLASSLQKRLGSVEGLLTNGEWTSGEQLPRYVRGLILLAGVLDDKSLRDKAAGFILPIINSANEGGDFGPMNFRTITPQIEAVKTLLDYYELTGDEKILNFLKKFFKKQYNTFSVFSNWYSSRARLLEEIPAIETVYRETDLEWLKDLGEKLRDSSAEWFKLSAKFPFKMAATKYISPLALKKVKATVDSYEVNSKKLLPRRRQSTPAFFDKEWKKKRHQNAILTDGVNIAKAVKYPVVYGRLISDANLKGLSVKLITALNKYHGTPLGMFSCDAHIAGLNPSRGVDVEAGVEYLESLAELLFETGDFAVADIIEQIVFNLIPSACFENMSAVSDRVCINQEEASAATKLAVSESEFGNAFVTKKLSKGAIAMLSAYPIFMRTLCLQHENELNFMTYAPCTINMVLDGANIIIKEETGYPFRNSIVFNVEKAEGEPNVKINFRVPYGTTMQLISGGQVVASGTRNISVRCTLRTGSTFMLKLDIPLRAIENRNGSISLMKGSVLLASKLAHKIYTAAEDKNVLNANFTKKWNITPVVSKKSVGGVRKLVETEQTEVNAIGEFPYSFEKPPFALRIRAKNVINWDYDVSGLMELPRKPIFSEEQIERVFIPFGCSLLRIAEFPKCTKK